MSRQRQEQLKKILASIAQPGTNVDKAAEQLDKLFEKSTSEATQSADQIISDSGRRGDTGAIEVPIDVQFKPIFGNLKAATGNASRLLTSFFDTYEEDLTRSLRTTETFIPQFNKLFLSLGNQRLAGFDQFKGLSSQYATDTKSLLDRIGSDLLDFYSYEDVKKVIAETSFAFQETFPRIRFETAQNEQAFFKLSGSLQKLGISGRESGAFFQTLTQQTGASPAKINQVTAAMMKLSEATGQPLKTGLANVKYFVEEKGYKLEEAVQASQRLAVQSARTGLSVKQMGDIFGSGMDTFDELANKTAELNAVFGVSLNPQEMIDMTADERMAFIEEALKDSGADLNDRLLQRQIGNLLGGEAQARKFLTGIQDKSGTKEAVAEMQRKVDAIQLDSPADAERKIRERAEMAMPRFEAVARQEEKVKMEARAAASGGFGGIERDARRGYEMEIAAQQAILNAFKTDVAQAATKTLTVFKRAETLFGGEDPITKTMGRVIGLADAVNLVGSADIQRQIAAAEGKEASERTERERFLLENKESLTNQKNFTEAITSLQENLTERLTAAGLSKDEAEKRAKDQISRFKDTGQAAAATPVGGLAGAGQSALEFATGDVPKNLAEAVTSLSNAAQSLMATASTLKNAKFEFTATADGLVRFINKTQGGTIP